MQLILIVFLGLCIGSFLNVCIYRIPREESISFPPSHCTSCNYDLKWYDLIPVISYILLRGKCRNCGQKISIKYPIIELVHCLLYILIFYKFGLSILTIKYYFFISMILIIGLIDLFTQFVYLNIILFTFFGGIALLVVEYIIVGQFPYSNLLGTLIGLGVIFLIVVITKGMGEGDIYIATICGLFLGIKGIFLTLFFAFILGGLGATIVLLLKKKQLRDAIAFGPYLMLGSLISIIYGNELIFWYLSLF